MAISSVRVFKICMLALGSYGILYSYFSLSKFKRI